MWYELHNNRQRGAIMVISLIVLIAVTLLAIFAMKSLGLNESVAGNTMEKQRATQLAETSVRYAELWVANGKAHALVTCNESTPLDGNDISKMRVCTNRLDAESDNWTGVTSYTPPDMAFATDGGLAAQSSITGVKDVNYHAKPLLHIAYLAGDMNLPAGVFYEVTAKGFGGNSNTVTVVQSTFNTHYNNTNLGGL